MNNLMLIKTKSLLFNYNNKQDMTHKAKIIKLKFKNTTKKNNSIFTDKTAPMRKILPNLINYIQKLIKKRKEDTFDIVKSELRNRKFINLINNYNTKIVNTKKIEFLNRISKNAKYAEIRPKIQVNFFKLFRKYFIKYLTKNLVQPSRLYKLYYLINLTKMHENLSKERYYRELIRKWRFISFSKKMTRKKLELMYRNLHASYMQMADEMFGNDNNLNPSIIKEFENFGLNVGMFTGQEPSMDEKMNKKFYSNVDRRYVFTTKASGVISDVQKNKKDEFAQDMMEGSKSEKNIIKIPNTSLSQKIVNENLGSIKNEGDSKNEFIKK
jgi:hypothetical protein